LQLSQFEIDRRQLDALNKLTELFKRFSIEKSFRKLVNKDQTLTEKAKALQHKLKLHQKKAFLGKWKQAQIEA